MGCWDWQSSDTQKTPHSNDVFEHCRVPRFSPLDLRTPRQGSQKLPYHLSHLELGFPLLSAENVCIASRLFLLPDPLPLAGSTPSFRSTSEVTPCHFPVGCASCQSLHPILFGFLQNPWEFMKPLLFRDSTILPCVGTQGP